MSARAAISLAPGFSRVYRSLTRANRFNGLPVRPAETVETVPASLWLAHTWLKPGANESIDNPNALRSPTRGLRLTLSQRARAGVRENGPHRLDPHPLAHSRLYPCHPRHLRATSSPP